MSESTMLWVGTSTNTKTGNIPVGYVGATVEETERSCEGCPLRRGGCYHWSGGRRAQSSMQRAAATSRPERYSLARSLGGSVRTARYARGAVGGDPWIFSRATVAGWVDDVRAAGLRGLILYTHFAATKGAHLKGLAIASTECPEEADRLRADGWRVALVAPYADPASRKPSVKEPKWLGETITTADGTRATVCPAQAGKPVDCNTCGLCDPARKGPQVIAFLKH